MTTLTLLVCDHCGENVTITDEPSSIIYDALGWTYAPPDTHYCVDCAYRIKKAEPPTIDDPAR